jgi:hypothetical protein
LEHDGSEVDDITAANCSSFYRFQACLNLCNIKEKRETVSAGVVFSKKESSSLNKHEIDLFGVKRCC